MSEQDKFNSDFWYGLDEKTRRRLTRVTVKLMNGIGHNDRCYPYMKCKESDMLNTLGFHVRSYRTSGEPRIFELKFQVLRRMHDGVVVDQKTTNRLMAKNARVFKQMKDYLP